MRHWKELKEWQWWVGIGLSVCGAWAGTLLGLAAILAIRRLSHILFGVPVDLDYSQLTPGRDIYNALSLICGLIGAYCGVIAFNKLFKVTWKKKIPATDTK